MDSFRFVFQLSIIQNLICIRQFLWVERARTSGKPCMNGEDVVEQLVLFTKMGQSMVVRVKQGENQLHVIK